jgi:hypothetical protein
MHWRERITGRPLALLALAAVAGILLAETFHMVEAAIPLAHPADDLRLRASPRDRTAQHTFSSAQGSAGA